MNTQREVDIAQVEAKAKAEKLFEEWRKSYLGPRAEVEDGSRQGNGRPEDSESPEANDYEPVGIGAEGAPVLPGAPEPMAEPGY